MSTIANAYGSIITGTITLNSLAAAAARQSTVINFGTMTPAPLDVLVGVQVKTGTTLTAGGSVTVYAYSDINGGTIYSDGATGTDGAITLTVPPNMRPIGIINTPAAATVYDAGQFSLAAVFGGTLPSSGGVVVVNNNSYALDATAGGSIWFQPVNTTVA